MGVVVVTRRECCMYSSHKSPNLVTVGCEMGCAVKFALELETSISIWWNRSEIGFWSTTKQTFSSEDLINDKLAILGVVFDLLGSGLP